MQARQAHQSVRLGSSHLALCMTAALVFPTLSHAAAKKQRPAARRHRDERAGQRGRLYRRGTNGSLTEIQRVDTGGAGVNGDPPSVRASSTRTARSSSPRAAAFVVNAGDDTISSFRVRARAVKLVDTAPSGGDHPRHRHPQGPPVRPQRRTATTSPACATAEGRAEVALELHAEARHAAGTTPEGFPSRSPTRSCSARTARS